MVSLNHLSRLFFVLIVIIIGCNKKTEQEKYSKIVLPENLETIAIDGAIGFENSWYNNQFKVVVFVKNAGPYSTLDLDWKSAIAEYPNVAFLFYVSEQNKTKLINHLEEVGFTHPIIHDPDEEFRKSNVKERDLTFISFLVRDNNIVGMSNPSLTDFKMRLQELLK